MVRGCRHAGGNGDRDGEREGRETDKQRFEEERRSSDIYGGVYNGDFPPPKVKTKKH